MVLNGFSNLTPYLNATGRLLQPKLWAGALSGPAGPDGDSGVLIVEDFRPFGLGGPAVAANVGYYSGVIPYKSYEDTGDAIAQLATEYTGAVKFTTAGTDNNESWLSPGTATSVLGMVSDTAGEDKKLIFDCRFKVGQVSNTYNVFIGLSEEGLAAANTVTDAGALADKDLLGFWILEGDGDALKFGYRMSGQAVQTVATWGTALAADTYYRVGLIYDPAADAAQRIKFFINNTEQANYVTKTNIEAATFPDGQELNALFGIKNGEGVSKNLTIDGWAFYQG